MDMTKLGLECSEMMECLASEFPDDVEVGVVGLVVEVSLGADTHVATFCSDTRRWVQAGIFREGARAVDAIEVVDDGD